MNPFVQAQLQSVIECLRLLEALVPAPLALHTDIEALRRSVPIPEAEDLPHSEERMLKSTYAAMATEPGQTALRTIELLGASLSTLQTLTYNGPHPLGGKWLDRAHRVLSRAEWRVAEGLRATVAARVRGLYVIVDPQATRGRPALDVAAAALKGGASVVQLRDKESNKSEALTLARQIKALCEEHGALFIVNDNPGLALASDAHGLHLGQDDMPITEARRVIGPTQIIGRSNNTIDEVMDSTAARADYLAVGAVFPTGTMGKSQRPVVGTELVGRVKRMVETPVVAIGGIDLGNVADVVDAGADSVCVVSAVTLADDPENATRSLVEAIRKARA